MECFGTLYIPNNKLILIFYKSTGLVLFWLHLFQVGKKSHLLESHSVANPVLFLCLSSRIKSIVLTYRRVATKQACRDGEFCFFSLSLLSIFIALLYVFSTHMGNRYTDLVTSKLELLELCFFIIESLHTLKNLSTIGMSSIKNGT